MTMQNYQETVTIPQWTSGHVLKYGDESVSIADYSLGSNLITAGDGNDTVGTSVMTRGYDTVTLGNGEDSVNDNSWFGHNSITVGNGNDRLFLNYSAGPLVDVSKDTITAGNGNDTVWNWFNESSITLGSGNDNVSLGDAIPLQVRDPNGQLDISSTQFDYWGGNNDTLTLGSGNNIITADGSHDVIIAGSGKNSIQLQSEAPSTVLCKAGNNTIWGSTNGDTFVGGSGNNLFDGGTGNDNYIFYGGFGHDMIHETGGWNQIELTGNITKNNIAFFGDDNNNLLIGDIAHPNSLITVQNAPTTGWINHISAPDGSFLSGTDVNTLIQEMNAYAASHGEMLNSLQDVENNPNLMAMINKAWHH